MKSGVPWNVRGVRAKARDTAREAARRSGKSVGDWLNSAIIESAADEGVHPEDVPASPSAELAAIHDRLDHLTGQIERIVMQTAAPPRPVSPDDWGRRNGAPPYVPSPPLQEGARPQETLRPTAPHQQATQSFAPQYAAPQHPAMGAAFPAPEANIDDAVAEIAARMRALDGQPPLPAAPAAAHPSQTDPYRPEFHAANAARQTAPAAAPMAAPPSPPSTPPWPTQDLSGLEAQLRDITGQIQNLHLSSGLDSSIAALREELSEIARKVLDAVPRRALEALEEEVRALAHKIDQSRQVGIDPAALASLEQGLAEVREALRNLTPAENLGAFAQTVTALSRKMDQMGGYQDVAALNQLDEAIAALRNIASHVASNDTLSRLADEMRGLSAKMDRLGESGAGMSAEAFAALESRIGTLTDQLAMRAPSGSDSSQLDSVIKSLTERLEQVHLGPADNVALSHLEDRIVKLVEKLDASEARMSQLGSVERGLADLLLHLEKLSAEKQAIRPPAAAAPPPAVDALQREVARTQNSIEDVHGTLDHVVDRLAMIETDIRGEAPRPTTSTPTRPVVVNPIAPPPEPPPAGPRPNPAAAADRSPINPNLPPDYPLEPGTGTPRAQTAAERIAASEAALAGAKPAGAANAAPTNFIAAARRAAQTATQGAAIANPAAGNEPSPSEGGGSKSISKRVRSLLTGLGVILLLFGVVKVTTNFLDRPQAPAIEAPAVLESAPRPADTNKQSSLPATTEPAVAAAPAAGSILPQSNPAWLADVTSSIPQNTPQAPRPGAIPATATPPASAPPLPTLEADKLPVVLRAALARGEHAAEYEAGLRYLEGRGVTVSLEEAARWFERAAKAGLAPAQFRLGSLYEKGHGVKKNVDTARRHYIAAAEKGNAKAMHNLAVLHAEGLDGKPDYKLAAQWFRKGADYGVADSQYNLGILYARGVGVEQNLVEAYKWFALAANQGDKESANKRDEIGQRLDQQSQITARLAVQTWRAESQPDDAVTVKPPPGGWDRGETPAPAKKQRVSGPAKTSP